MPPACSTSATATGCTGRRAVTREGSQRWSYTAVPDREAAAAAVATQLVAVIANLMGVLDAVTTFLARLARDRAGKAGVDFAAAVSTTVEVGEIGVVAHLATSDDAVAAALARLARNRTIEAVF